MDTLKCSIVKVNERLLDRRLALAQAVQAIGELSMKESLPNLQFCTWMGDFEHLTWLAAS